MKTKLEKRVAFGKAHVFPCKYMNLQNSFVANQTELNQIVDEIIRSKIEQIEIKQEILQSHVS